jgi:hypothetical protein
VLSVVCGDKDGKVPSYVVDSPSEGLYTILGEGWIVLVRGWTLFPPCEGVNSPSEGVDTTPSESRKDIIPSGGLNSPNEGWIVLVRGYRKLFIINRESKS